MRAQSSFVKFLVAALAGAALLMPASAQEPAAPPAAQKAEPAKTGPKPQVLLPQAVLDLGDVTYGEVRMLEFPIQNTGDDVLRIHAAKSSCGCVVTEFTQ
jgi:hypothetical protein